MFAWGVKMFDTKIAIVLRNDLAAWQELNVTAFLATGIVAGRPELIGEAYRDRDGNEYNPMAIQPMVVLTTDQEGLRKIHGRALERMVQCSAYVEEMFATGGDVPNREVFAQFAPDDARLVGIAMREQKKIVDKITKGARLHA